MSSKIKISYKCISPLHTFQGKFRKLHDHQQFDAFFMSMLPNSLKHAIQVVYDASAADCVVYPVADFAQVVEAFTDARERYPDMSVVVSYIREHIDPQENGILAFVLQNTPPKHRLLLNGWAKPTRYELQKVISIDTFAGLFQDVVRSGSPQGVRSVSILAGALKDRLERAYLIAEINRRGLNRDVFITSIYNEETRNNLLDLVDIVPRAMSVKRAIDGGVFQHFLVDRQGFSLDGISSHELYTLGHEFCIPPQVCKSRLNVALETRWWAPSVTEKIFKPIIAGVPFVWFAQFDLACYLAAQGYRPYPKINYTFDAVDDRFNRIDLMIDEIERVVEGEDVSDAEVSLHNMATFAKNHQAFHKGEQSNALRTALSGN